MEPCSVWEQSVPDRGRSLSGVNRRTGEEESKEENRDQGPTTHQEGHAEASACMWEPGGLGVLVSPLERVVLPAVHTVGCPGVKVQAGGSSGSCWNSQIGADGAWTRSWQ